MQRKQPRQVQRCSLKRHIHKEFLLLEIDCQVMNNYNKNGRQSNTEISNVSPPSRFTQTCLKAFILFTTRTFQWHTALLHSETLFSILVQVKQPPGLCDFRLDNTRGFGVRKQQRLRRFPRNNTWPGTFVSHWRLV